MAIPANNKPADKKNKNSTPAGELTEELKAQVDEEAAKLAKKLKEVNKKAREVEKNKVEAMFESGEVVNRLSDKRPDKLKKKIVDRLAETSGMSSSFFYLSAQFQNMFSEEDANAAIEHGLSTKVIKALVTEKNTKIRNKLIQKAIEEGLTADEIRTIRGTKGARAATSQAKARKEMAKKPPFRIFTQASDRSVKLSESIGYATDAIGRIGDVKESDQQDTIASLLAFRDYVQSIMEEAKAFLKHTDALAKKSSKSK